MWQQQPQSEPISFETQNNPNFTPKLTLKSRESSTIQNREISATKEPATTCRSKFDVKGGIFLYFFLALYSVLGLALLCEEELKHSLIVVADKLKLSESVAGATLAAASTSSPELMLSLISLFSPGNDGSFKKKNYFNFTEKKFPSSLILSKKKDIGSGTIIGSAVFNVLMIIGGSALLSPHHFKLDWRPIVRDVLFNSITFTYLILSFLDGKISL